MTTMNKRALLTKINEPFEYEEKPIHPTPPEGVVIKIHYSGICHSDIHVFEDKFKINETTWIKPSDDYKSTLPIVLGHEVSGEIYSIGPDAKRDDLQVGDRVVCRVMLGCKECSCCLDGDENMCDQAAKKTIGCSNVEGGYQQYIAMGDARDVMKVPGNMSMDTAAILACGGLTAYNAVLNVIPTVQQAIRKYGNASLLVVGAGGLGHWGIKLTKAMLPPTCKVVCVDISEEKAAVGMQMGADASLVWPLKANDNEIKAATLALCPHGVHAVVDFVNSTQTVSRAFMSLSKGACMTLVGCYGGEAAGVPLVLMAVKAITIRGVVNGSVGQLRDLLTLVSSQNISPPPILKVKLEEAFEHLIRLREGKINGRAVIDFVNY